ncbi:SLC13 family permease [Microbacterium aurantiacum]|uniref:SLC13 family permease n=1 Tax=Microbacterium aurantiacum TaxID=162393 RepID=UPI000C7FC75F|nr:SLC13 family permease [Microbacterium aurantiacum]
MSTLIDSRTGLAPTTPRAPEEPAERPARVRFATLPPAGKPLLSRATPEWPQRRRGGSARPSGAIGRPTRMRRIVAFAALAAVLAAGAAMTMSAIAAPVPATDAGGGLTVPVAITVTVFLLAVWAWTATRLDDTLVALLAAIALIAAGVLPVDTFFASLGDPTIWLLIGAFVIAAGVTSSGLAMRGAAHLLRGARSPRALFHLTTVALTLTAFAVPATSGRAALAIPVFTAVAAALAGRDKLVKALALLFPTVILLSAAASLLGAGAHIITNQLLVAAGGEGFTFLSWLWFGLPVAVISSHLACEIILWRFTDRRERAGRLRIGLADFERTAPTSVTGPLSTDEWRAAALLAGVIVLWSTEPLHQLSPALVALLGAVAAVSPVIGCTRLPAAVAKVPWGLLLFLAATLALASALTETGAAAWLSGSALAPLAGLGDGGGVAFILVVIGLSIAAHLLIPSRSARSAAVIPVVIALAPGLGVEPMAAAFASTVAAGFCHTLPSSAKPVAMFADPAVVPGGFAPNDLRRLSVLLAPAMFTLVAVFAFWIWPAMGMPLMR